MRRNRVQATPVKPGPYEVQGMILARGLDVRERHSLAIECQRELSHSERGETFHQKTHHRAVVMQMKARRIRKSDKEHCM